MVSGLVNVFLAGEPVAAGGTDGGHLHAVTRKMEIAEEIPPTAFSQRCRPDPCLTWTAVARDCIQLLAAQSTADGSIRGSHAARTRL